MPLKKGQSQLKKSILKIKKKGKLPKSNLKEKLIDGIELIKRVQVVQVVLKAKKNPLKNLKVDL